MPDANGQFKGAAYPHIPRETEADRRRNKETHETTDQKSSRAGISTVPFPVPAGVTQDKEASS